VFVLDKAVYYVSGFMERVYFMKLISYLLVDLRSFFISCHVS